MSIVTPQDFTSILAVQVDESIPVQQVVVFSPAGGFTMTPPTLADANAANGSLYYSVDAGKLVYKDAGGVVYPLH